MKTITHKHHIIPRHMGGTDDPSNITELSVEDHALAHLELYYAHNSEKDLRAFYKLLGWVEQAEWITNKLDLGRALNKGTTWWTNGLQDKRSKYNPGKGWVKGRRFKDYGTDKRKAAQIGLIWWTDGSVDKKAKECPGKSFYKGRSNNKEGARKGALANKGKKCWTNGKENKKCFECPGDGWVRGMTHKNKSKAIGKKWYTDGVNSKMCREGEQPSGWVYGRSL